MLALSYALLALNAKAIPVRVDPRVELVTTVFRLADPEGEFHMAGTESEYTRKVDAYFAPYKNHSAVEMARRIRESSGIGFDAVPTLAVNLTDIDKLGERIPFDLPPARWDKRWSAADARAFVAELKKFVRDTHYKDFLRQEQPYFQRATLGLASVLKQHNVGSWVQDFYGTRPSRAPFAIVGLLCGGGNYGMSVEFPDGGLEMSPIFGASEYGADGAPVYGDGDLSLIVHEFSHGYVNPLVRKDFAKLIPAAHRFMEKMRPVLASHAYGSEDAVLYETFVRACETYLVQQHLSPDLADRSIVEQRSQGFLWTSDLVDALSEYGRDRAKYRSFAGFLPVLEESFIQLSRAPQAIYARCPGVESVGETTEQEDAESRTVTLRVSMNMPMRTQSRGVSISPEGWEVVKKTQFEPDGKTFSLTVKLKKGTSYKLSINRQGGGLLNLAGYPAQPFTKELGS